MSSQRPVAVRETFSILSPVTKSGASRTFQRRIMEEVRPSVRPSAPISPGRIPVASAVLVEMEKEMFGAVTNALPVI